MGTTPLSGGDPELQKKMPSRGMKQQKTTETKCSLQVPITRKPTTTISEPEPMGQHLRKDRSPYAKVGYHF